MTINVAKINDAIQEFAPQVFADTLTRRSTMFNLLSKRPPSSPQGPRWKVKVTGASNATPFAEGAAAPTPDEFEYVSASLAWGNYHTSISLSGPAMDQLDNAGGMYITNYVQEQFADSFADLVDEVEADIKGGATTNGITGLTAAIDSAGTYAGISRSTYSTWGAYQNDNSGTPHALTMAIMDDVHNNLTDTIGGSYTHILCDTSQFDAYTALSSGNGFPATPQFNLDASSRERVAVGGVTAAYYRNAVVVAIPGYTSGRMDFVDLDQIWLEVSKPFFIKELGANNADLNYYARMSLQLCVKNPRKHTALIEDLS